MIYKQCLAVAMALCIAVTGAACFSAEEPNAADETRRVDESEPVEPKTTNDTQLYSKGNRLPHARLRIELTPTVGFDSGKRDRQGDSALRTNIDYEIPIVEHLTISPRLIPIMYYSQRDDDPVWIAGFGLVFRGYSKPEQYG